MSVGCSDSLRLKLETLHPKSYDPKLWTLNRMDLETLIARVTRLFGVGKRVVRVTTFP